MDMKFCFSCGMPLEPNNTKTSSNYCQYCTTSDGKLKSREETMQGIMQWIKSWQPDMTDEKARVRAASYMKAMPAWADN